MGLSHSPDSAYITGVAGAHHCACIHSNFSSIFWAQALWQLANTYKLLSLLALHVAICQRQGEAKSWLNPAKQGQQNSRWPEAGSSVLGEGF